MDNKDNGFTLVELLAVIAILGVLLTTFIPSFLNSISNKKSDALEKVYNLIETAGLNYAVDYNLETPTIISLEELCDVYITCPIINPKTEEELNGYLYVDKEYKYYESKNVTLTVDPNGGTLSQKFEEKYQSASIITVNNPTKANVEFKGWEVVKGNSILNENKLIIGNQDTILWAKWETTSMLTVNLNGGSTNQTFKGEYKTGAVIELIEPTKTGYVFTGWTVEGGTISGNILTIGTNNVTLTANFTPLVVQAIYSATDNSLMFIYDRQYSKDETYNGKVVTAVYTGFTTTEYDETAVPWYSYRSIIKKVEFIDEVKPTSLKNWFRGFSSCTEINLKKLNTSQVTSLYHTFDGMSSLTALDVSHFDTSKVTSMGYSFQNCSNLTTLYLSNFDTSNVTAMHSMFQECKSLTVLDLSKFDTGNVTAMHSMFQECKSLTTLDLSNFDTSNVTSMYNMFAGCISLITLDVSKFNTSNVTNMFNMFLTCSKLTTLDLSNFNTSKVTRMEAMFYGMTNLTTLNISNFNTSNVTNMSYMFRDCTSLTTLDISNFDTTKVTDMSKMFRNTKLYRVYVGDKWATSAVTTSTDMFTDSTSLIGGLGTTYNSSYIDKTYARIDGGTISPGYFTSSQTYTITYNLNGGSVSGTNVASLKYATSTTLIAPTKEGYRFTGWTVSSGLISGNTFTMGNSNVTITANFVPLVIQAIYSETDNSLTFINDVLKVKGGTYNGKSVTEVYTGFETASYSETTVPWYTYRSVIKKVEFIDEVKPTSLENWFRGFSACTEINLKKLNTSNVTSLYHTFDGMSSLTTIDVSHFDTSKVTSMSTVFKDCSKLTTLDLSNWNTSKVTVMHVMFENCWKLKSLNISNFNTNKVTSMYQMFNGCGSLTTLNLTHFNTSNVTNMSAMFQNCSNLTSLNISNFNTIKITSTKDMFYNTGNAVTETFSIKLGNNFNTSNVTSMQAMFSNAGYNAKTCSIDLGSSFDTSNVTNMYSMFDRVCSFSTTTTIKLGNKFDTSNVTNMENMFAKVARNNPNFVLDLSSFNTSKVTNMINMFNGITKLKTIYVGDKWTTSAVTSSTDMFSGSTSLVGGMGTTYNSSYIDKTYARIDATGAPGYFTYKASS